MKEVDLSEHEHLAGRVDSLLAISRSKSSQEIFRSFMLNAHRMRRFAAIVGVSVNGADGDRYRIAFKVHTDQLSSGEIPQHLAFDPDISKLELHEGGFIAELLKGEMSRPRLLHDFDLADDPVLGDLAHAHSAVVIPAYANGKTIALSLSFFEEREPPQATVVDAALVSVNMLTTASRHLSALSRIEQLNGQLTQQLEEVARLQQALLPRQLPEVPGLELASSYLTSDRAGGDYYDFFELSRNRWGILIADASGHGPAAATVMAMLHAIMHSAEKDGAGPEETMRHANRSLCKARLEGAFATAFFAVYEPRTGLLEYSSAGHNPPLLKHGSDGAVIELLEAVSLPLGILPEAEYERGRQQLHVQDSLIFYTDGITESFSAAGEMFGTQRLMNVLVDCTGAPDCTVESIHRALFAHTRRWTRSDDQTIVTARFHGMRETGAGEFACNLRPHIVIPP